MKYGNFFVCIVVAALSVQVASALQAEDASVDFDRDIRPILSENCFFCHGPDPNQREADLRLDVAANAKESAIEAGTPEESELSRRVWSNDPDQVMPPPHAKLQLTKKQKELLDSWIRQGANYSEHWSFVPPTKSPLPKVAPANQSWLRNPIDHFVAARLEAEQLRPSTEASRETLIRRVTFDLTGLPPSLAEVDAFLADTSPTAYEKVVDRLLASPHYGERMALVWLDAARYADSGGYQNDIKRTQWPWRDWVIRAYNANMPFDQFSTEQLAGDLLENATTQQQLATAFNRNHRVNNEGGIIPEEWRVEYVADRVETTSSVWLGLTIGCARCHDHKYDPFSQKDFYRLFAYFNNIPEKGRTAELAPVPNIKLYTGQQGREAHEKLELVVQELNDQKKKFRAAEKEFTVWFAEQKTPKNENARALKTRRAKQKTKYLKEHSPEYSELLDDLSQAEVALTKFEATNITRVSVMEEMPTPRQTFLLARGDYSKPDTTEELTPATLGSLPAADPALQQNRLQLARWLFQDNHPLTARVAVNRYWQMYFGTGLVATPEDFGSQGSRPSHPRLLDWLASEFRESGWDVKAMQKTIVTSATYRQQSRSTPALLESDPTNRLFSRGPRFRLYAQAIRDQALMTSGLLVPRIGGPPVMPQQPDGLWEEVSAKGYKYVVGKGEDLHRRSLYTFWRRTVPPPNMMNFDSSTREICSVNRARTNTPLQAMNLLNDPQFVEAARALALRMINEGGASAESRISFGHRLVLAREPSDRVFKILMRGYADYMARFESNPAEAEQLIAEISQTGKSHTKISKLKISVAVDSEIDLANRAALIVVANVLLNLDETVTKE